MYNYLNDGQLMINSIIGCTITISFNKNFLYIAYHWEEPGFTRRPGHRNDFADFDRYVLGFLRGDPEAPGQDQVNFPSVNPPLLQRDSDGRRKLEGAKTLFITEGSPYPSNGAMRVGRIRFLDKIRKLADMAADYLKSPSSNFTYLRPAEHQRPVQLSLEYSAVENHLRVMVRDGRSNIDGAYRVIDWDLRNWKQWPKS